MQLSVPDMSCGHCKASVETALKALDPSAQVQVDLATRQVTLETNASATRVIAALQDVGFDATPV
ncbi:MAG: heavy-metal-associated domain-containing protein [Gemmobacter sp.]|nr:heavy-metal-associated domain-containing protein [Gemmobacter sp.]